MTFFALAQHFLFAFGLFLFSSFICFMIIKHIKIVDTPNKRSSHNKPTPTIGGVAIVVTFFLGMGIIYFVADETMITSKYFAGYTFSSLLIASIAFYDDYKQKSALFRLIAQIVAVIVVMSFGIVITSIDVPFLAKSLPTIISWSITFLWILGLTNAYNFMDGLHGMAGGNALIAAMFFGIISFSQGSNFAYIVCVVLIAGTSGFLVFNFPKGKLFMGDVGSMFLGFSFATLAIISSLYDNAHTSLLVIPLLLFHFIYDTVFTFTRRFFRKENVFQAHRTHLYQLFNQLGYSHTTVTLFYWSVAFSQGLGAYLLVNIAGLQRLIVFIPFLLFQIIYSMIIIYYTKKRCLL